MKKINYILLLVIFCALILTGCEGDEYLGEFDVSILSTLDDASLDKEAVLYYDNQEDSLTEEADLELFDYHNAFIKYINDNDEFGLTDDEMLYIINDLGSKSSLNEYERYNLKLLMFSLERYRNYDYGILEDTEYALAAGDTDLEVQFYDYNKEVREDLDNDGIEDVIMVYHSKDRESVESWHVSVNGIELKDKYKTVNPAEQYAIVKLGDKNRIVLSEYGYSFDDFSLLFTWDGKAIIDMCANIEYSNLGNGYGLEAILLPNKSGFGIEQEEDKLMILSPWRLTILQTWFTVKKYELINDSLYEIPNEEGYFPVKFPVFLLEDITLYKKMEDSSDSFIMEKGQVVTFTATDNENYIKLVNNEGRSGWYKVSGYFENTSTFYGLSMYD